MDLRMKNYALFQCTAQQLLGDAFDGDDLIYAEDPLRLADGSLSREHHQVSKSQAKAIMRRIVQDDVISEALRNGIQWAILNPDGNMPVNGAHHVDPAVALIEERAILPVLGALPPGYIVLQFVKMAYRYFSNGEDPSMTTKLSS
jgi:hypothetical protein